LRLDSADAFPADTALLTRLALRAAHDLNNLLAVLSGNLYLMRAGGAKSADLETLDAMQSAVAALERLSRSLSAVGAADGPAGMVDVGALARSVAAEGGASPVEVEVEPDLPAVAGSAGGLRAALRALVANAAAAAPGSAVRMAVRRDGRAAVLSVEDRGGGIPPEAAARAFDPFFSTRGGGRGTGIGLFVAAAVAAAHGGSCVLESRDGGGTVASLRIPLG